MGTVHGLSVLSDHKNIVNIIEILLNAHTQAQWFGVSFCSEYLRQANCVLILFVQKVPSVHFLDPCSLCE